jgi:hypothetical protein
MRQSSGFAMVWVERLARGDDRAEQIDAAAGEGDDRLMVALATR